MRVVLIVSAVLSAVVPGLGQLVRRRWVEAILFLLAAAYLRLLLTGLAGDAVPGARVSGLLFGAFGVRGGLGNPTFTVFTVLTIVLHALAAWDAGRRHTPRATGPGPGLDPTTPEPPPEVALGPREEKAGEAM